MSGTGFRTTLLDRIVAPILRPLTRAFLGFVAVPIYRLVRRRVPGLAARFDKEFEKDLEQWFRGSLLLLLATKNFETWAVSCVFERNMFPGLFEDDLGSHWPLTAGRLLLAIAVIEAMPDQELFAIIHPGPPPWKRDPQQSLWWNIRAYAWPFLRGVTMQYLNRTAPVLAIMAVIFGGLNETLHTVGWACYSLAIAQYLIIGLITSRDMMFDVLARFDHQIARRRRKLIEEFDIDESKTSAPLNLSFPPAQAVPGPDVASGSGVQYDSTMEPKPQLPMKEQQQAAEQRQTADRQEADAP